jgi:hypothetical protein
MNTLTPVSHNFTTVNGQLSVRITFGSSTNSRTRAVPKLSPDEDTFKTIDTRTYAEVTRDGARGRQGIFVNLREIPTTNTYYNRYPIYQIKGESNWDVGNTEFLHVATPFDIEAWKARTTLEFSHNLA